jgi:hypothetical protein
VVEPAPHRRSTIASGLAGLVPRPRINLILYHGVLGPRAAWRSLVVGFGNTADCGEAITTDTPTAGQRIGFSEAEVTDTSTAGERIDPREARTTEPAPDPPSGREGRPLREEARLWADLMRRTFGIDVLACPRCGGRFRLIALIEEASVIERILRHLHLPTEVPTPRPGRAPPLLDADSFNQDTDVAGVNSCA